MTLVSFLVEIAVQVLIFLRIVMTVVPTMTLYQVTIIYRQILQR